MSSSIYDVSSIYDTYSRNLDAASASSVEGKLSAVGEDASDEELLSACEGFEEYFLQKIIEQARKSVSGDEEEDGEYMKYFGDTLNQAYAEAVVDGGGIGLAKQLYDSIQGNHSRSL